MTLQYHFWSALSMFSESCERDEVEKEFAARIALPPLTPWEIGVRILSKLSTPRRKISGHRALGYQACSGAAKSLVIEGGRRHTWSPSWLVK